MRRALLIDPENQTMRYNFACALSSQLRDTEGALDLLGPYLAQTSRFDVDWAKADPDLAALRDKPRFQSMIAEAETRLAAAD